MDHLRKIHVLLDSFKSSTDWCELKGEVFQFHVDALPIQLH